MSRASSSEPTHSRPGLGSIGKGEECLGSFKVLARATSLG